MTQAAKFIDVTKSFLPLDPNSYPQSLQTGRGESTPEDPIPVVAYAGKNFLPTAYGYRSFFGTAERLNIDTLNSRPDHVFVLQSLTLENIVIALCDDGIWHKTGSAVGAWEQGVVTYDPTQNPDVYHRWTYCILENSLYAYQEGRATFWKISSDGVTDIIFTEMTPNFLNMSAQVGIFRAGSRLGFWDTANSTAWSNLDDFEDFTPSTLTLAGSAKFSDIVGTIVDIRSHGDGFIIYATKSITHIRKATEELFQWDPKVIFSNNGIVYPRQVTSASPDTKHFCYTTQGIYQIENGKEELIIPEVFDFFEKDVSVKYLKLLQGRYLCFEVFSEDLALGRTIFSNGSTGDFVLTLPGAVSNVSGLVEDIIVSGENWCPTEENLSIMLRPGGSSGPAEPGDRATEPLYSPRYKAFLRPPAFLAGGSITYSAANCPVVFNGETIPMQPADGGITAFNTTFREVNGADAYVDGKWTMTRFVQAQTALWDMDTEALAEYKELLLAKVETRSYISGYAAAPAADSAYTVTRCGGIQIPAGFSPSYQFDISPCAFTLTRYALGLERLYTKKVTWQTYVDTLRPMVGADRYWYQGVLFLVYDKATLAEILAHIVANDLGGGAGWTGPVINTGITHTAASYLTYRGYAYADVSYTRTSDGVVNTRRVSYGKAITTGWTYQEGNVYPNLLEYNSLGRYAITQKLLATLELKPENMSPVPDTARCELQGWEYEKANGTDGFLAVSTPCTEPASSGRTKDPKYGGNFAPADDGSLCGKPFEPITIPGSPPISLVWPEQTVVYPGTTFVLRDGTPAPLYPTAKGAYVYDLHLKKWGKYVGDYKHLLDYSPINANTDGILTDATFGIVGGIFDIGGSVRLFDKYPTDSYITYGKLGWNRARMTSPEEVRVDFAEAASGYIRVETSLDGRNIQQGLTKASYFTEVEQTTVYGCYPGKWHQITVGGWFDISYIEYKGFMQGKR